MSEQTKTSTRNSEALESFTKYCQEHPDERFWQALRNWSGYKFILAATGVSYAGGPYSEPKYHTKDTFYWEGLVNNLPKSGGR